MGLDTRKAFHQAVDLYQERAQAAIQWRRISFVLALAVLLAVAASTYLATQYKVVPYIVQVDSHGYEVAVGPLESSQGVDERVIMSRVGRFVETWRSIASDTAVMKKAVLWIYASLAQGSAAQVFLDQWYKTANVFAAETTGLSVSATVNTVLKVTETSWRVEWTERSYTNGRLMATKGWTGLISIGITPSTNMAQIISNPLGIYVTDISATPNLDMESKNTPN